VSRPEVFDKVTALAEWLIRQGKDPASVEMIKKIASSTSVGQKTVHRRVAAAVDRVAKCSHSCQLDCAPEEPRA
jgi:hypothetical protein